MSNCPTGCSQANPFDLLLMGRSKLKVLIVLWSFFTKSLPNDSIFAFKSLNNSFAPANSTALSLAETVFLLSPFDSMSVRSFLTFDICSSNVEINSSGKNSSFFKAIVYFNCQSMIIDIFSIVCTTSDLFEYYIIYCCNIVNIYFSIICIVISDIPH